MDRFRSLTSRLVLTVVALVALVCVLIAGATTLAMGSYLNGRLDEQVRELADRPSGPVQGPGRFSSVGTLQASFPEGLAERGDVVAAQGEGEPPSSQSLSDDAMDAAQQVPSDGDLHDADIPGLGSYRVISRHVTFTTPDGAPVAQGVQVSGLPTQDVDYTLSSLLVIVLLLCLAAVVAAGAVGTVVVRRQLRPLREVAATAHAVSELPLASGAITLEERVPPHLTDERTEVGQVGSALNTMLEHVGSSLEARHRSEQQVRQFVADASHELRTPLTTIAGYTELARSRPDDRGATDTALAKVEEESGRMTALVEDLLLLARLDSGRPLVSEPVDLTRLLVDAVSDARVLAPDHRWRLSLPESSVEVLGDERRLHQVVTNLLANARKYTPPGTTVTVSAHPGGFAVHDDGPGFPPDLVDHAFERFARGDLARTRANGEGGHGLGLSLVEAIVTAHGGCVRLRSSPGDTTVSVHLQDAIPV